MVRDIALTLFLGKPLIAYGGIFAFLFLISTAAIGIMNIKGIHLVPLKWHYRLAFVTIIIALIHAIFGLSLTFGF